MYKSGPTTKHTFLSGGGEMGELIRTKNWSATAIGDPNSWPQSLRITLGIMLHSKFPMFLWWGPDLIQFYNDAYRPSFGNEGKHPLALGQKGKDCWPEIWTVIKPLIDSVMYNGNAHWSEDQLIPIYRNGKLEDVYWTFSYSPVTDDEGKTGGVLVVCSETTQKVTSIRQMRVHESMQNFTIDAAELGTWDLDPSTNKFTGNESLKEWFGLDPDEQIDLSDALNAIDPQHQERVIVAIEDALNPQGTGLYEVEYDIINAKTKQRRTVIAKGKALFENNVSIRFSGILQDITEKVESRQRIKDDAELLLLATEGTKLATWDLDLRTMRLIHSPRLATILGAESFKILTQNEARKNIHPDDKENVIKKAFEAALKTGRYYYEARVLHPDQQYHWIRVNGKVVFDDNKKPLRMLGTMMDITEQKIGEEHTAKLAAIVSSSDDAIISKKLDGTITSWNDAAERMFGYTAEEIIGQSIIKLIPPDKTHEEVEIVKQLKEGKKIDHFQTQRLTKDNRLIDISLTTSPLKDAAGNVVGASKIARDISRQKENEHMLTEHKQQLEILINASDLGTWELYLNPRKITTSPRYLEILGIEKDATVSYEELLARLHPDDLPIREAAFKTAYETSILHYVSRIIWRDKTLHWVEAKGKLFYDDADEPYKIIGTIRDLTEEKLYQQRIEESESRLRIAALSGELGTWDYNIATHTLTWDNASRELFGAAPDEVLTMDSFFEKVVAADQAITRDKMQAALNPDIKAIFDTEYRVAGLPGNELRWIHAKGKALFDEDNIAYRFSGTVLNITEKKVALLELQENEQRYRFLADAMPQFVWTGGADGVLNYFNEAVYQFSGLSHEQIIKDGWLQIVHPDDTAENIEKWNHSVRTGEPFLFEHRFRRSDGSYRWQLSRALPQKDNNGTIQMWVGTSTDIDEIKRHEEQKNDFIKMANHELKTPVTTIKGYVQLLLKTHAESGDALLTSSLKTVDKQVTKLTSLVSDLLDVTKIERGSLPLNKEIFLMGDLVSDCINDMSAASHTHKIILHKNANPAVLADRDRISQVMINLFTNAFKYSPLANEVVVSVQTSDEQQVIISVQDFGIGIAEQDQEKIFERFYRVSGKDEKTFPGFGIGLFIVNEIMTLHSGKLWVNSKKDEGATFYFSLPIHE